MRGRLSSSAREDFPVTNWLMSDNYKQMQSFPAGISQLKCVFGPVGGKLQLIHVWKMWKVCFSSNFCFDLSDAPIQGCLSKALFSKEQLKTVTSIYISEAVLLNTMQKQTFCTSYLQLFWSTKTWSTVCVFADILFFFIVNFPHFLNWNGWSIENEQPVHFCEGMHWHEWFMMCWKLRGPDWLT